MALSFKKYKKQSTASNQVEGTQTTCTMPSKAHIWKKNEATCTFSGKTIVILIYHKVCAGVYYKKNTRKALYHLL